MIRYLRTKKLDSFEIAEIERYAQKTYNRILRKFKDAKMLVEVKPYKLTGKKKKYAVHVRLQNPNLVVTAEQAGWELSTALKKTFSNLENSITHKFKKEVTQKRRKIFKSGIKRRKPRKR